MIKNLQTFLKLVRKGVEIIIFRFREQGVRTTLLWLTVRGVEHLTGIPWIRYGQIRPDLYIGPQYRQFGRRKLMQLGITASVNLRTEFDDAAHGLDFEHYCYLPTVDDEAPSFEQLVRGVEFIRQAIEAGRKVYVHCTGGIGRAPTMVAAYLVDQGNELEDAISTIRRVRPFINIMSKQKDRLREYQSEVRGDR